MSKPEPDPAIARFAVINSTRILGVGFVVFGILLITGRLFPQTPEWIGYLLLANGLVDIFILPAMMARKWRTPK